MTYTIETASEFSPLDVFKAAALTAAGFERPDDAYNHQDTKDHLLNADIVQFMRSHGEVVALAAYRRLLWR